MRAKEIIHLLNEKFERSSTQKTAFENAVSELISSYDTSVYENRFIVGGVVERLFGYLLSNFSEQVKSVGGTSKGFDLHVGNEDISIKYSSSGTIKIRNSLGENTILEPEYDTIFILLDKGSIYGVNKEEFQPEHVVNSKDGLSLKRTFFKNKDLSKINIDIKYDKSMPKFVASDLIANDLIKKYWKC